MVKKPKALSNFWHVIPENDMKNHKLVGLTCWCSPVEVDDEDGVILHNSMDQRELYSLGEREFH